MLKTLDFTIRIGSTPTSLYFDLYLFCALSCPLGQDVLEKTERRERRKEPGREVDEETRLKSLNIGS